MTEDLTLHKKMIEDVNNLSHIVSNSDQVTSTPKGHDDSDAEHEILFTKSRKKLKHIAESDNDEETSFNEVVTGTLPCKSHSEDSSDNEVMISKKKSRIRNISNSDSESDGKLNNVVEPNKYDFSRTKLKSKKLHDKFKTLKHPKSLPKNTDQVSPEVSDGEDKNNSSDDTISCSKIKQNVKKKSSHSLTSICDPDTSEDESNIKSKPQKSKPRSTKLISSKPVRMSAKQAMENMQKIKSESNRMLREKEVSLPYHRPKALTLKDIINRRKPAVTADGKSLPIKMNNDQLKQYALMLEERQKEMMELCKSDTDDEEEEEVCLEGQDTNHNLNNLKETKASCVDDKTVNREKFVSAEMNDSIYDEMILSHNMSFGKGNNLNNQNIEEAMVVNENHSEESLIDNDKYNKNDTAKGKVDNEKELSTNILAENESHLNTLQYETEKIEQTVVSDDSLNDLNKCTEEESQVISLHYDSEKTETTDGPKIIEVVEEPSNSKTEDNIAETQDAEKHKENMMNESDDFSDNDFTMEELDKIIENTECNKDKINRVLPNIEATLEIKPMLMGAPGMVINLDDSEDNTPKKLTGVELLKERFTYFAKLKSLEEMEKDREKKFKPGVQHLKLKQALEEQIAEQRSLEWEKRLQEENQLKIEMNTVEGEQFDGENIEKIEAKLEESDVVDEEDESSSEEELEENDVCLKDKPRLRNLLVDDEAEVSDGEDVANIGEDINNERDSDVDNENNEDGDEDDDDDDDDEDSSESEQEIEHSKCRKGRILKAFEDSDDEDSKVGPKLEDLQQSQNNGLCLSQDDEIQLAQPQKTYSDDLFTSEECTQKSLNTDTSKDTSADLGSQTFSILKSTTEHISTCDGSDVVSEKIDVICETQPCSNVNFDDIVGMCTAGFSQNVVTPQAESSQLSQSQELGDDVAAMCTGKFYDNPFVSQTEAQVGNDGEDDTPDESFTESTLNTEEVDIPDVSEHIDKSDKQKDSVKSDELEDDNNVENNNKNNVEKTDNIEKNDKLNDIGKSNSTKILEENKLLKSIIDELGDPEFDSPKPNKYFLNDIKNKDSTQNIDSTQFKKKFVIESDEETNDGAEVITKKKRRKKRKLENRALQISDDEEDEYSEAEQETYGSDMEQDNDGLVEYDSEENEVDIQAKVPKLRPAQFFEQEAELSSEGEWMGSGDEDEAGLDRMEREEGDEDTFHQGRLQRELGEIHMREVLDQDKREVRLLQELFFEDGDLGDGHRQRKFRWKNIDGEEESGTNVEEYADTQEDEFESEEQWRKQRHEREMFLRKMQENGGEEAKVSINRSALIKATLTSKNTSISIAQKSSNTSCLEPQSVDRDELVEKKTTNKIPSPKKPFIICQQNYHNSLLTRGRGALARLAALATPLAGDGDDAPVVNAASNRGNFVFAALSQKQSKNWTKLEWDHTRNTSSQIKKELLKSVYPVESSKVTKRKADTAPDTPRLIKKMKKDTNKSSKNSLLDHL